MTTKITGGVISSRIAATLEANYAAALGDVVMGGPGDFQVVLCDGSKPPLGVVVMPNVKRGSGALAGTYPQANTPGDVSVGLRGHSIQTFVVDAAQTVVVGTTVGIKNNKLAPGGTAGYANYGIALNGGTAGTSIDVVAQ